MTDIMARDFASRRASTPWLVPAILLAILAVFALVMVFSIGFGSTPITPDRVISAVLGLGSRTEQVIILKLRMPRALLAMEAGACLALAGLLLQTATRNPLASPSILGIVDGAALGVVVFLFLFSNESNALVVSVNWQPVAAALGALCFALVVGGLTWLDRRGMSRMILYGIAMAALASAMVTIMIIVGPVYRATQALTWLAGSVYAAHWNDVMIVGGILALAVPFLLLLPRDMEQLSMDDQSARASGLAVTPAFIALVTLSVVLTATAVSFVGGVAFVGLLAPHAARLMVGHKAIPLIIASALIGATIVVAADLLGRVAFVPIEVPTGAITAIVGAPYFLWLLIRRSRSHA